jgi:hypothetical protein
MPKSISKFLLGLTYIILFFPNTVRSQTYFVDCDTAFKQKEFSPLAEYFKKQPYTEHSPDQCFKLNNREFLVTVTDAARIAQGLYFCDINKASCSLHNHISTPAIKIERDFTGENGKRFVLISWSNLHSGNLNYGYDVLYLVPRTNKYPFIIEHIISVNESPTNGLCSYETDVVPPAAESIESYKVKNEGTKQMTLEFKIANQNCKTNFNTLRTVIFSYIDGKFITADIPIDK